VHLRPQTTVYIENLFKKILQKSVLKYGKPVYPGAEEDYYGNIHNLELRPGIYRARIDIFMKDVTTRSRKIAYFLVGLNGKVLFKFFRS